MTQTENKDVCSALGQAKLKCSALLETPTIKPILI